MLPSRVFTWDSVAIFSGVTDGDSYAGALAGESAGSILECSANGKVSLLGTQTSGESYVGGLVGYQSSGNLWSSYAGDMDVKGHYAGGLVGYSESAFISYSFIAPEGSVEGAYVGGLVGYLFTGGNIYWSYSHASVESSNVYVGGIAGSVSMANTSYVYSTGRLTPSSGGNSGNVGASWSQLGQR